ncbi:MAG: hypothetical protein ACRD0U_01960, partial [Acidimicrobiales bacterium]
GIDSAWADGHGQELVNPSTVGDERLREWTAPYLRLAASPRMAFPPHDHRMWAAMGVYTGQEDNTFYRRAPGGLVGAGGRQVSDGEVLLLGDDAIHAVANPRRSFTGSIHVYGGDLLATPRSERDPVALEERDYDVEAAFRYFEEQNAKRGAGQPA